MANSLEQLFVGQGKVYLAPRTSAGQTGGFVPVGDADSLAVNITQTFVDHMESMSGNRNTVIHAPIGTVWKMQLNIQNWSADNIAKAFYGDSTNSIAGGTVTTEAIVAYNGAMTPLANPGVSAVTITLAAAPHTALVADTDYTLDAVNGNITILAASTLVPAGSGVALNAAYTYAAYTGKVEAATHAIREYVIRFEGLNVADSGNPVLVTLHRCVLDMSTTLPLLSTQVATLTMSGMLVKDETQLTGSQFMTIVKK